MVKMIVDVRLLDRNVKQFKKDVALLFTTIKKEIKDVNNHQAVVTDIQHGLATNKMGFHNSDTWKKAKQKLKELHFIENENPLNLTGQLVKDLYWSKVLKIHPDEWSSTVSFRNTLVYRPTTSDVYTIIRKGAGANVKGQMISSHEIVRILQNRATARYPIIDNIYNLYQSKMYRSIEKAVDKAFRQMKN